MAHVDCPKCNKRLRLPDLSGVHKARCPQCGQVFRWEGAGGVRGEATARVKAKLTGIVVTSVEPIAAAPPPARPQPIPSIAGRNATQDSGPRPEEAQATTLKMTSIPQPRADATIHPARGWASSVSVAIGWVALALAVIAAVGQWVGPSHRRDPSIEAMMTSADSLAIVESMAFLLGSSILGLIAFVFGLTVYRVSRRTAGRTLMAVAVLTIVVNVAVQLRPSSESLAGKGLTSTTPPQAEQAAKDLSKILDRAVPPPGEAPSVDRALVASGIAHGELSHVVRVVQDLVAGMLDDATEYKSGVVALRLDSVLLPMRLDSAAEINDSKTKTASAQRLFEKYSAAVRNRMKTARDGLATTPYSSSVRDGMLRSFDSGMAKTMPQLEKVLAYEGEMYSEVTVLLDFMLTQQGKFRQVGSQLKFDSEADAATYNASLTRYQAIAAKQASLRELMHDEAKANVDRMRRAAETGSFDGMEPVSPTVSVVRTRIDLETEGPSINGKALSFPMTVADVVAVLGPPSRTLAKINTICVWDAIGIYAYSTPGNEMIDSLAVAINKQHEYEFSPKNVCAGPILLASIEIRDIDTPRSLNRRLKGVAFESFDPGGASWDIHFPAYTVSMSADKAGLSDTVHIRGRN